MDEEDAKGTVFRIAKQMVKSHRDVIGSNCIKNSEGKIVVDEERIKEVWHDYYKKLLNVEFDWNRNALAEEDVVVGPAEEISLSEVKAAIAKMKSGKAAGPSGIGADMLKAAGEAGALWVKDLCN